MKTLLIFMICLKTCWFLSSLSSEYEYMIINVDNDATGCLVIIINQHNDGENDIPYIQICFFFFLFYQCIKSK